MAALALRSPREGYRIYRFTVGYLTQSTAKRFEDSGRRELQARHQAHYEYECLSLTRQMGLEAATKALLDAGKYLLASESLISC